MFVSKDRVKYFRDIAEWLDQGGGVLAQDLFNLWLLRDKIDEKGKTIKYYPFGNIDETPSSVIGKNKLLGTFTKEGKWIDRVLDRADKNHSIDAIEENP